VGRWAQFPVTAAIILASVIYLARKMNTAIRKADEILALPTAYRHLRLTVEANTQAIDALTLEVARLAAAERARGTA
jgi:hypothetical protein